MKKVLKEPRQSGNHVRSILTATKLNAKERLAVNKLAMTYTKNGDVSKWLRMAALHWKPSEADLEMADVAPKNKKGRAS